MPRITINRFDGGKASNLRTTAINQYSTAKHCDAGAVPNTLIPLWDMEADDTGVTDYNLRSFLSMEYTPGTSNYFALGNQAAPFGGRMQIYEKSTPNDITSSWTTSTNATGTGGSVIHNTLIAHRDTASTNTVLYSLKTSGSDIIVDKYVRNTTTFTENHATITNGSSSYTGTAYPRPHIHSKSNFVYLCAYNKLARINQAGTFSDITASAGLSLSYNMLAMTIDEIGNYLAIGAVDVFNDSNSKVYLWDRDESLTTFNEVIDWGAGRLMVLGNLNGYLVGVSQILSGTTPKIVVAVSTGGQPQIVAEMPTNNRVIGSLHNFKGIANNKLYFALSENSTASDTNGIYVVGQNAQGEWYISESHMPNNGTAITNIFGFGIVNNTVWVQYDGSGAIKRSNDSASYTATSIYESTINPNMPISDRNRTKDLVGVRVNYEPLNGGTVGMSYKVDGGSYTTIFSHTTATGESSFESRFDTNGAQFTSGREYQFKITSYGGVEITGFEYLYENNTKDQI